MECKKQRIALLDLKCLVFSYLGEARAAAAAQTPRLWSTISVANSSWVICVATRSAVSSATHSATSLAIASDLCF